MVEVGRTDIESALRQLGITHGDVLMVHSSLSSFGRVEGGADTVVDALVNTVGTSGTLAMPAFCQKDGDRRFETWDIERSPSDVGRITEVFRLRPGVIRSDHATHSVCACGPRAKDITEGHARAAGRPGPWGPAAFGVGCPYDVMYELGARILLIGVDFSVNTAVHYIEHLIAERALAQGRNSTALRGWQRAGVWPSFDRLKLQHALDDISAIAHGTCGSSALMLVALRTTVDEALHRMASEPEQWFSGDFCAWMRGPDE